MDKISQTTYNTMIFKRKKRHKSTKHGEITRVAEIDRELLQHLRCSSMWQHYRNASVLYN